MQRVREEARAKQEHARRQEEARREQEAAQQAAREAERRSQMERILKQKEVGLGLVFVLFLFWCGRGWGRGSFG